MATNAENDRISPRRRLRCWLTVCLAIAFLLLTARLALVVWQTETAVEVLREQWLDRTLGQVFYNGVPVDMRSPKEQTDYWLETIERAHRRQPFDATTAMGAAMVLDNLAVDFAELAKTNGLFGQTAERNAWGAEAEDQAARCRPESRRWAADATEKDPENVDLLRLRARVIWPQRDAIPDAELIQILQDAARHDPQNALYPYLLAMHDWEQSCRDQNSPGDDSDAALATSFPASPFGNTADDPPTTPGDAPVGNALDDPFGNTTGNSFINPTRDLFNDTGDGLIAVWDYARFDRGVAHFQAGQDLPLLEFGIGADFAHVAFLSAADTPVIVQRRLLDRHGYPFSRREILDDLAAWQHRRAEEARHLDDKPRALDLERQMLSVLDQFARDLQSTRHRLLKEFYRVSIQQHIDDLENRAVPPPEARAAEFNALLQYESKQAVVMDALATHFPNDYLLPRQKWSAPADYPVIVLEIASSLVIVFLLAGAICLPLSAGLHRGRTDFSPLGPWRHALLFSASFLLVFLTFVIAPLELMNESLLKWGLLVLLLAMLAASVGRLGWQVWRSGAFRFRLSTLLVVMLLVGLLLGGFARLQTPLSELLVFPPAFVTTLRHFWWEKFREANFHFEPTLSISQWFGYAAHWLTLAVWLPLLACFLCFQIHKRNQATGAPAPRREQFAFGLRTVGLASLGWATVFMLIYLVLAPGLLQQNDERYQYIMAPYRRTPAEAIAYDEVVSAILQETLRKEVAEAEKGEAATLQE
ncbi:hypothetical protein [Lignipirellula cremea]|uniref:Uncharacterized protein n=1 Tax=Lignipirellula cremea TaxID=2528010 RepID=A0A518DNF1_9BACT|nr:hypothetical protein [Lignipirellula cremea]QDU93367.1 hypothetical protein Pla8534_11470 [Lignipirellula cremea]